MTNSLPTAVVVIPARIGSTRFAEKVLAADTGRPMVQHVVDRARRAETVSEVIVATDNERVRDALRPFGTTVVMTSPAHPSGTDRVAEVMASRAEQIAVNVQADEPEIDPGVMDALVRRLAETDDDMATAAAPYPAGADPADTNLVKVVTALDGRALYFSRAPIPHPRDESAAGEYHLHLGIYAYRRTFLLQFAAWGPTPLELAEKLEQLRALEHGASVGVILVGHAHHGIDTREQYEAFSLRSRKRREA